MAFQDEVISNAGEIGNFMCIVHEGCVAQVLSKQALDRMLEERARMAARKLVDYID